MRVDKGYIDHTLSPDGGYQKVESVPYAIAFLPASAMFLVNVAIDLIDNNWASVHIANKFSSIGFQEISRATQQALNLSSFVTSSDSNSTKYEYDLNIYIKECIIKKALDYKSNASFVYAPSKPFPENLNPTNFPVNFGGSYIDYIDFGDNPVTNQTCTDAYSTLVSANAIQIENAIETKINTLNPTKDFTSTTASAAFREQIGDTANVIGTLKKAVATTVTGKFLQRQQSLDAVGVDGYSVATQLSIDTTLANLRSEGPAKMQWIARVLPDVIFIISGIAIAAFPLLIIVQSFMGATAFMAIANYFMGFFAFYFNLVGLALVQNIVSFYTSQEAQQSIAIAQNMPFSVDYISDFLIQQANMTGLAGMVGAASIFVLTPLIFYGEMKGFSAALSGVTGAFRGGVDATANDTIRNSALEAEIDRELMEERNGMTEIQAIKWLSDNGYSEYKRANMSSLETYSQIMKGYGAIGSGFTAQDLMHSGNVPDYIKGSYLQSTQQAMKTIGMGNSIDSIQNAGEVAMQDGQVMAESINATDRMRNFDESSHTRQVGNNYDTEAIGYGMAAQQFGKDMGMQYTGEQVLNDFQANDGLLGMKQTALDNLLSKQNQAAMQISKDDYSALNLSKRDEANGIAKELNKVVDEIKDLHFKDETVGLGNVEQFRLEQLQEYQDVLSKNWNKVNDEANEAADNYFKAKSENEINHEVDSFNNDILLAKSDLANFEGKGSETIASLVAGSVNQSRIQANKAMGMGKEDLTSDQMLSVQATSHASMLSEFQEGKTLRDKFGNNLDKNGSYTSNVVKNQDEINAINEQNDGINKKISSLKKKSSDLVDKAYDSNDDKEIEKLLKKADKYDAQANDLKSQLQTVPTVITNTQTQSLSYEDMITNEASNKLAGRMGSAKAFESTGFDMIASNVEYGAISQALSTASKIATQGGIEKAVAIDVAEASMKAAMQQGALKGQIEEYAQKTGMTTEVAKQFATEIINGAKVASELIGQGVIGSVKDVSSALSAAKTGSDIRSIDVAGGDDRFIQLSKDQASLKTAQSLTSVNAAKNANFLNDDGITNEGLQAYGIQAGEQASILGVKRDLFFGNGSQGFIQKLRQQMKDAGVAAHIADGKSQEEAQSIMESAFNSAGFTNKANGQDAINALAKMGAMNYASSKTISAGGVQFNMGIGADGNTRIGQATTTQSIEGGSKYVTEPEGRLLEEAARLTLGDSATQAQVKQEAARLSQSKHLMKELRSSGIDYLGMGVGEGARALLEKVGLAPESETGNLALGVAAFGGATLGLAETAEQIKNKIDGKYIAKEGFSYQTGTTVDKDGVERPVFKEVKSGAEVNVNSSPELKEYYENNKDNFSLKKGTTGRAVGKMIDGTGSLKDSLLDKFQPASFTTKDETIQSSTHHQNTKSDQDTKTDIKQSTQNTPPVENSKDSITQNEPVLKSNYNLTSSAQERKNEALNIWAKEQKADAVAKYKSEISKLEQPYSSKEIQVQKDALTNSYYKQVEALDKKYGAQTYEEKGEMKTQAPDEYFEKIKNLNERYVAQNNALDVKANKSLPSHVLEAKETLHNELQEKIQDIDIQKNMMKNANPETFVKTSPSIATISDDFIQPQPAPHKDHGKLPSSIKGGGIGALLSSLGMSINDIAHGKDWNHTLKATGSELYSSVQSEGVVGTIRDMAYSGKENRMLIEKASNENSFFKTAALMGTSVVEGFAELGGSVATVTNNYSRAAANTIWGNGSFTKNLLEQEKDDNVNNFNFTKDLNGFWENGYNNQQRSSQSTEKIQSSIVNTYESDKTIATINPNTGAITPNHSYQSSPGQTLPSFFTNQKDSTNFIPVSDVAFQSPQNNGSSPFSNNNNNPFVNNTAQVIADSGEEQRSYIRDMGDSLEVQEEAMGELLDYLKVKEENRK